MDKAKILIIEDEVIVAYDLADMLTQWDYEVVGIVSSGEKAVEKARETNPDLVLADVKLKGKMDGIEASHRIRDNCDVAIVYLTARTESDLFERAKKTEPHGYLTKPVSPQEVLRTVEMALYKHEMEKRLRQSEARYRQIVETANEGIWIMDGEFRTTFVNQRMADMLGYSADEMIGRRVDSFIFAEDLGDHETKMRLRKQGEDQIFERRLRRKDGETLWTAVSATALQDSEGNFDGSFGMFTDITERKKMEVVLREREGQLEAIFQAYPAAIFLVNPEGRITFANQSMGTLFSCASEELLGTPYIELVHQDERSVGHTKMKSLMAGEIDHVDLERRYVAADGREFLGHLSGRRLQGPDGVLTGLVGIVTDITDSRKVEEALRESESRYRAVFDNAAVGIDLVDEKGRYLQVNDALARMLGYSKDDLYAKTVFDVTHPDDVPLSRDTHESLLCGDLHSCRFEKRYIRKGGEDLWADVSVSAVRGPGGEHEATIAVVSDITARKRAEQSSQTDRQILEDILEASLVGYWDWDISNNTQYLSPAFKKIFGYEDDELLNSPDEWKRFIFPEDLPGVLERFDLHVKTHGRVPYCNEVRYRHKDGSTIWVICSGRVIDWDQAGNPVRMVGCHVDITALKRMERALTDSL
jgi:two-component system cell cycle sensor histidine kinase/response regulator CckA